MKTLEHEIRDVLSEKQYYDLIEQTNNNFINMLDQIYEEKIDKELFLELYESYIEYLIEQDPWYKRMWSGAKDMANTVASSKAGKIAGKLMGPLNVASDAYGRYSSGQSTMDVIGGTAASALGALGGTAIGGPFIGGTAGSIAGSELYDRIRGLDKKDGAQASPLPSTNNATQSAIVKPGDSAKIPDKPLSGTVEKSKSPPEITNPQMSYADMGIKKDDGVKTPPQQNAPTPSLITPRDTSGSDAAEIRRGKGMSNGVSPPPQTQPTPQAPQPVAKPAPQPTSQPVARPSPEETKRRTPRPSSSVSSGSFSQYPDWAQKAFQGN